ncbi:CPBP family intramembrane metalloprotease [Cryobacterium sp. SO2]|uniref:CPBP family intramembrane glutamic endopeptidase n=1 Tax=Cryobacterium sp. SO2 TaxID=1897060 RepID=UPI00223D7C73|nr:CPBP family intramembrane glutamic endopeptidase [Cryobacterium sp. SO2]WEO77974.1 CPBP family intramembrane metalloprotease [Cryobacterium sp. SO2]
MTSAADRVSGPRPGLGIAAVGLVSTVLLVVLLNELYRRGVFADQQQAVLLSYLVVWLPLLGTVLTFCFAVGARPGLRGVRFAFQPLDLLWGLTLGVVARVLATVVEIAGYGRMGSSGGALDAPAHDLWWVFAVILAPVVVSPYIEELFFRGLVQRAVQSASAANRASPRLAVGIAVAVSAVTFALLHVIDTSSITATVVIGVSTLLFGLGAGALTAVTGRLGGAIVAHVVFNALVVLPAALGG